MGADDTRRLLGRADVDGRGTGTRAAGTGQTSTSRWEPSADAVGYCVLPSCERRAVAQVGVARCGACASWLARPVPAFLLSLEAKRRTRSAEPDRDGTD